MSFGKPVRWQLSTKCEIVWVCINDRTNLFFVSGGYVLCNRPVLNEPFWMTGQSTSQAATWWTNRLLQPLNPRAPPRSRWRMAWCKGQSSYQSSWATCAGPVHHSQAKRYYTRINRCQSASLKPYEVWTQWTWEYPRTNGKNGDRVNQLCGLTMAPNEFIIGLRCLSHCPSPQKSFNGFAKAAVWWSNSFSQASFCRSSCREPWHALVGSNFLVCRFASWKAAGPRKWRCHEMSRIQLEKLALNDHRLMLTRGGERERERERAGNRGIIMELQQLAVEISLTHTHTQNHLIIIQMWMRRFWLRALDPKWLNWAMIRQLAMRMFLWYIYIYRSCHSSPTYWR